MSPEQILNPAQLQLLLLIGANPDTNLLKARTRLSWDVEKFAVALHSLETAGLIRRSGFKASSTPAGAEVFRTRAQIAPLRKPLSSASPSYLEEVRVAPLSLSEPWLPNFERFSRAIQIRK